MVGSWVDSLLLQLSLLLTTEPLLIDQQTIPKGPFLMGCTPEQATECHDDESPVRMVFLSYSFAMMKSEVTQQLYHQLMSKNPSEHTDCPRCPVENVSWFDAVQFANALSIREKYEPCYIIEEEIVTWPKKFSCNGWRLPTEAEWEKAARGQQPYRYAGADDPALIGWYESNSQSTTHHVCTKQVNDFGLCDMSGNVYEWVWDWWGHYNPFETFNPSGPSSGTYRTVRGGYWDFEPLVMRVADRGANTPHKQNGCIGFRLVRTKLTTPPLDHAK